MNKLIRTVGVVILLSLATSSIAIAEDDKEIPKITIEEMEVNLAKLEAEIADEKVKLSQRESILYQMKLALLKKRRDAKNK